MVEVVPLKVDVDESLVEVLERYLEWARSGELRGLATVTIRKGDLVGTSWHGSISRHLFLGAVTGLQARMASEWVAGLENLPGDP